MKDLDLSRFGVGGANDDGHRRIVFLASAVWVFLEDGLDMFTAIDVREVLRRLGQRRGLLYDRHGCRHLRSEISQMLWRDGSGVLSKEEVGTVVTAEH